MDVIERVARAIADNPETQSSDMLHYDFDQMRDNYLSIARAAIEAMREPPEAIARINGAANWSKMIDAILSATPSPEPHK